LALETDIASIRLPILLWTRMVMQLRRRSAGRRESGAFLLGRQRGPAAEITDFICYDDLDPQAYQNGAIAFHAPGYAALWEFCRKKQLQVLADVHTHPGSSTCQSSIDQRNPMVPVPGHTALIVPYFGRTPSWSLKGIGIYEYLGDFRWRAHNAALQSTRLKITLW
jgi:proteasome lid subunit RPN8/RPN11